MIQQLKIPIGKNIRVTAGFTVEDDKLPDFFYNEVSKAIGATFDVSSAEMQATLKLI